MKYYMLKFEISCKGRIVRKFTDYPDLTPWMRSLIMTVSDLSISQRNTHVAVYLCNLSPGSQTIISLENILKLRSKIAL